MAAVEDDEQGAAGRQVGDQHLVQHRRADLALTLVVDRHDAVVHARGGSVAVHVWDLASVARVVQEAGRVGFGDEPLHGSEDVVGIWVHGPGWVGVVVVAQDDLGGGAGGVVARGEELADVVDVGVASAQGVGGAGVVDADEEGLLARHGAGRFVFLEVFCCRVVIKW